MICLQSHRNLVFLTKREEKTASYSGLCNILQPAEIPQGFGNCPSGGYLHRFKTQGKCDWKIVVCTLQRLVSVNTKLIMPSLLKHLVAVRRVRTKVNVYRCTERTTTSASAKDSREKTAKTVRKTPIVSPKFSIVSLPSVTARENDDLHLFG